MKKSDKNGKVKCTVCGAVFDASLEKCPVCAAGPESRVPAEERSGKVKCTVCGEVFDASLEKCPVCAAGPESWIPAEEAAAEFRNDTSEKFIILGGGPGAFYAAKAVRERNATCSIVMITDEDVIPYNRPMLTKALLDDISNDRLAIEKQAWFDDNSIFTVKGQKIKVIDTAAKEVECESGMKFAYDKLVYALGAYCFVPPIKGSDRSHVFTVRNVADVGRIKAFIGNVRQVVCIGGGVMGLEGAWELKKGGYDVTVLETAPGLLAKQLDDTASAMTEKILNDCGISCVCGASISEITADKVVLADGRTFDAQMVIMSTGMRPNTAVAEASGIAVDKFVEADLHMRTNVKDIYSVGDCTAVNGVPQAFWAQAAETGRIAGANAAGEDIEYDPLGASLVINAMNTSIFALGTNGKDPDKTFTAHEFKDEEHNIYEKYYFENDKLRGVILIGDTSRMVELADAVKFEKSAEEVLAGR